MNDEEIQELVDCWLGDGELSRKDMITICREVERRTRHKFFSSIQAAANAASENIDVDKRLNIAELKVNPIPWDTTVNNARKRRGEEASSKLEHSMSNNHVVISNALKELGDGAFDSLVGHIRREIADGEDSTNSD